MLPQNDGKGNVQNVSRELLDVVSDTVEPELLRGPRIKLPPIGEHWRCAGTNLRKLSLPGRLKHKFRQLQS